MFQLKDSPGKGKTDDGDDKQGHQRRQELRQKPLENAVPASDKRLHELNVTLTSVDLAYRAADQRDKCRKEGEGEEYGREQSNEHMQRPPLYFAPESIIPLCRRIVALQG
ncbi:hypothetical protein M9X92_012063 [Pyricularia oryzae]|nr:hypothetical protein M9X92_012063 [Pyricularia oryzae]